MDAKSNEDTDVNEDDVAGDVLWGVGAIADFIGRTKRQTYYLIDRGIVPVTKHGAKTITASRERLRVVFSSSAIAEQERGRDRARRD
jgi:hypothetical protein